MAETEPAGDSAGQGQYPEEHLKHYHCLVEGEQKAYESFDKYLVTLSAGALALSVNLVNVLGITGCMRCLLLAGWVMFCLSLISILASFLISARAWRWERERYNELCEGQDRLRTASNPYSICTFGLNVCSAVAFATGVILVLIAVGASGK